MKLSIIVPIYKVKIEYLEKCINSLLKQGKEEYEIILIDDGSPDECGNVCDNYAKNHKNISVIHQSNKGVSVARNVGINKSKGDWIFFVDPDDWIENDILSDLIKFLDKNNETDIIVFNYINEMHDKSINNSLKNVNQGILDKKFVELIRKCPFYKFTYDESFLMEVLWNKIYKKEFIENNQILFIEEARKGQDRLFNAKAFVVANNFSYYSKTIYHYRTYNDSITHKYNPKILDLTLIELEELKRLNNLYRLGFESELNARVCTRIYSCLRLKYYNRCHTNKNVKKEIEDLLEKEIFRDALAHVDYNLLNFKEKVFVILLKIRFYFFLKVLIKLMEKRKV